MESVTGTSGAGSASSVCSKVETDCEDLVPLARTSPTEYARHLKALYANSGGVILGNVLEWYDWGVYAYMSSYITKLFFTGDSTATWLVFLISFIARPFGAILLGWIGDTFGRKISLNLAVLGMSLSTFLQGCICTWMPAPGVIMLIMRVIGGISAGGESSGVNTYMSEIGTDHTLAGAIGVNNFSGAISFFAANLMSLIVHQLPFDAQLAWGWRIPFLLAGPTGVLSFMLRRSMLETEAFLELQKSRKPSECEVQEMDIESSVVPGASHNTDRASCDEDPHDVKRASHDDKGLHSKSKPFAIFRSVLLGVLVGAGINAANYFNVWIAEWLETNGMPASIALSVSLATQVVRLLMTFPVSFFGDAFGTIGLMRLGAILQVCTYLPAFLALISLSESGWSTSACAVAFLLVGIMLPIFNQLANIPSPLFTNALLSADVRARGAGVAQGIASIFGGAMPLIGTELGKVADWATGLFLTLLMLMSFLILTLVQLAARKGWLRIYLRPWLL